MMMRKYWHSIISSRPGGTLIYTVFALALVAILLVSALMVSSVNQGVAYNQLRHRQLLSLSESAITLGLWRLENDTVPKGAENFLFCTHTVNADQHVEVILDELEPSLFQVQGVASVFEDRKVLYARVLRLDKVLHLKNPNPHIVLLSEIQTTDIDLSNIPLPSEGDVLFAGFGGKKIIFNHKNTDQFQGDIHFCSTTEEPGRLLIQTPVTIAGTAIVEGDVVLDSTLRAKQIYIQGNILLQENGQLIAEQIFFSSLPEEEIIDQLQGECYSLPNDLIRKCQVHVIAIEEKSKKP